MPLYDRNQKSCEKRNDLIKFSPLHWAVIIQALFCNFESISVRTHMSKVAANLINLASLNANCAPICVQLQKQSPLRDRENEINLSTWCALCTVNLF
jgi:hypothetical protein